MFFKPKDINGTILNVGDYVTIDPKNPKFNVIAQIVRFKNRVPVLVPLRSTVEYTYKFKTIRKMSLEELTLIMLEN
jgi:hypothetical protein